MIGRFQVFADRVTTDGHPFLDNDLRFFKGEGVPLDCIGVIGEPDTQILMQSC
jgi:hypothetical protein